MDHNTEVLQSINSQYWELKPGKYSDKDNPDKEYMVCYNPLAFAYCALQDNILFNDRLSTEVKTGLIKHLANIFHSKLLWKQEQRGRKIGIEADLTRRGLVSGEKNFTMEIEYYRRATNDKDERLESFIIKTGGGGGIAGHMPFEHMVTID